MRPTTLARPGFSGSSSLSGAVIISVFPTLIRFLISRIRSSWYVSFYRSGFQGSAISSIGLGPCPTHEA